MDQINICNKFSQKLNLKDSATHNEKTIENAKSRKCSPVMSNLANSATNFNRNQCIKMTTKELSRLKMLNRPKCKTEPYFNLVSAFFIIFSALIFFA